MNAIVIFRRTLWGLIAIILVATVGMTVWKWQQGNLSAWLEQHADGAVAGTR